MSTDTDDTDTVAQSTPEAKPEWLSLEEGERIEWQGKPSTLALAGQAIMGVVLMLVLIGFLILLFLPVSYLGIKNTDYVVTNRALYVKTGIASTNIESVSLDRIQNTEFRQSFLAKRFGLGSIAISTAGSSGKEIGFDNIEDAREIRQLINRLANEYAGSTADGVGGSGDADRRRDATEQMETLVTELRETRQALQTIADHLDDEVTDDIDDEVAEDIDDETLEEDGPVDDATTD